jgi:hypothetical protein
MKFQRAAICLLIISVLQGGTGIQTQAVSTNPARVGPVKNRQPLATNAFYPLPLGAIKPRGWLRRQLQIQADGLSGHLDEFWPDIGPDSAWLGGPGEGWTAKANKWVNWTLSNQRSDGSIGPVKNTDWWPNMIVLKVLTQYQEATGDPRVIPLMQRYFQYHARHLTERPLREWAKFRWGDEVLSVLWLYNRTGDPRLLDPGARAPRSGT